MRLLKSIFVLGLGFIIFPESPKALDAIDLHDSYVSWSWRSKGYRSYRIEIPLASGKSCVLGITKHVNPRVTNFTVLLQGFGADRWAWEPLLKQYEKHPSFTGFVAIDWPFHGDTRCSSLTSVDEIVDVLGRSLQSLGIPIGRIIGASLGAVPAALLAEKFPNAQQVWITPPFLAVEKLRMLKHELLGIQDEAGVQALLLKIMDTQEKYPRYVLRGLLGRIRESQKVLDLIDVEKYHKKILSSTYRDLLIIVGAKDRLTEVVDLAPELKGIATHPVKALPCHHHILKNCGESVKGVLEASRLRSSHY